MPTKKESGIVRKLYEELPIELWMDLANKVRRMNFSEKSEKEFYENLKKIVKKLSGTEFDITTGTRNIKTKEDIGLSALLHQIYQIETLENSPVGLIFYKKIKELLSLGIKTIEFLPVGFPDEATLEKTIKDGKTETISKIFTDGEFEFCRYGKKNQNIRIGNLKNANYILKLDMKRNINDELIVVGSKASLRMFDGSFPIKNEITSEEFPKLDEAPAKYFFDTKHILSKQIFKSK